MSYAIVTAKIDPETKLAAQKTAESLGVPLSIIIKAFLKQFVKTRTITISDRFDEVPNSYLRSVIAQAEINYKKGKISPAFNNSEDVLKYLEDQGV